MQGEEMYSIIEFLKTGQLGRIVLGISLEDFELIAGVPDDVSISKKPMIYKYGSFQFSFSKTKGNQYLLSSVHLYIEDEIVKHDRFYISDMIPNVYGNQEILFPHLQRSGVMLQKDPRHTIKGLQDGFITQGGVVLIFSIEGNEKKLISMHKSCI